MGRWVQRHRDTASFDERRLKALRLLSEGRSQAEVARLLGVTPAAVCYWHRAIENGGAKALRSIPRPGRPTLVPREKLSTLPDLLARGALSFGFSTDLWTIPRILQVTEAAWGVRYTSTAMWRLLKRHGLSWQRPRRQAREKDLRAVKMSRPLPVSTTT
ncbi:MAG: winged helix-turn-helix domain-containing protein [Thermoplasmata archaeon]